ncbi:MAG: radical SAM protein [Actinomycetes bacterium]|jgi:radical SAM protein with 4Fe4S-binding SPASM domain|nr:radical SAM protein [Actinomycetes bacterium]
MAHVRSLFFEGVASESETRAQQAKRLGRPSSLIWNITNRCNLLCSHCYMAADGHVKPDQLSDEQAYEMVDRMEEAGVPVVFLSGGEPMMRPNFWEILKRINKAGVQPTISTNCTFVTPKAAQRLAENGVRFIATSIYGPEYYHDALTQVPGTYQKVVKAIKNLRAAGVKVAVKTALTRETYEFIYDIVTLAKELDCSLLYICDLITSGRSAGEENMRVSVDQWRRLCDFVVDDMLDPASSLEYDIGAIPSTIPYIAEKLVARGVDVSKGLKRFQTFSACPVGQGHMTINSEGGVMPCQFAQDWTVGNIHDISFDEATSRLYELDAADSSGQCAPEACDYSRICRGCRVKAWQATGNAFIEDTTCILDTNGERTLPVTAREEAVAAGHVAPCAVSGC